MATQTPPQIKNITKLYIIETFKCFNFKVK